MRAANLEEIETALPAGKELMAHDLFVCLLFCDSNYNICPLLENLENKEMHPVVRRDKIIEKKDRIMAAGDRRDHGG